MNSWYDIKELSSSGNHDEQGIMASVKSISALIETERENGIPYNRIILAGFSQGTYW